MDDVLFDALVDDSEPLLPEEFIWAMMKFGRWGDTGRDAREKGTFGGGRRGTSATAAV